MGKVESSYVSEHTKWMREMLAQNPEWVEDQQVGRSLWWDKRQEPELVAGFQEAKEAPKSYPYDVNFFGE